MGNNFAKGRCLFLPAQSGKTRKVEEEIKQFKEVCGDDGTRSIDLFISANNRLLVRQTGTRLQRDLCGSTGGIEEEEEEEDIDSYDSTGEEEMESDAVINGNVFSWTCGSKATNISAIQLAQGILLEDIEVVIMCANKKRTQYLQQMLETLTSHKQFRKNPFLINIWIDEADSSINIWKKFASIHELEAVHHVTLVSATFGKVLKHFPRLKVIPYAITHPACYRRLRDCTQVVVNFKGDAHEYIAHIFDLYPHLVHPGKRAFLPGDYTKESHYKVADYLSLRGFAIIIINGECKELRIPGEPTIDLSEFLSCSDPEIIQVEFNQTLAQLYKDRNLKRFPIAITGYLCVQRGVTFQCPPTGDHAGFVFDYGIIPSHTKGQKAEAYQTAARCFGNTGDFPNYVVCTVYSDARTFEGIRDQEETAVNLPRLVSEEGLETVGLDEFRRASLIGAEQLRIHPDSYRVYAFDDVIRTVCQHLGYRYRTTAANEAGFRETSVNKQKEVVTLKEAIKGVPKAYGGGGASRTSFPCYLDKGDSATLRFVLVIRPETTAEQLTAVDALYPSIEVDERVLP